MLTKLFARYPLAVRMTLSVCLTALLVMIPLSLIAHQTILGLQHNNMKSRLPLLMEHVSDHIGRHDAVVVTAATVASQLVFEGTALMESTVKPTHDELFTLLERVFPTHPAMCGVVLGLSPDVFPDASRTLLVVRRTASVYQRIDFSDTLSYTDAPWFTVPQYTQSGYWDFPFTEGEAPHVATYYMPIYERGEFLGVIGCDLSLDWIDAFIQGIANDASAPTPTAGHEQTLFLLNAKGMILSHPESRYLYQNINDEAFGPSLRELARKMLAGKELISADPHPFFGNEAGPVIAMQIATPNQSDLTGWVLGIFVPQQTLQRVSRSLWLWQLIVSAAGFLILFLLLTWVSRSVTRPLLALQQTATTIAQGDLDTVVPMATSGSDEVSQLATAFEQMRNQIKLHMQEQKVMTQAKERMESELRIAQKIQMSLVPRTMPETPHRAAFDLAGFMQPARDVGGDFYDFFMLTDTELCLVIADVSGKSIPGSLTMARTSAFFRCCLQANHSLPETMRQVNSELCRDNDSNIFVTLLGILVDLTTGQATFCSAGHNPPYLVRGTLEAQISATQIDVQSGLLLGIEEDAVYKSVTQQLQRDDRLFLYTDGVTEALDPNDALFGDKRLAAKLVAVHHASCSDTNNAVLHATSDFTHAAPPSDDITMIAFRWLG